MTAIASSQTQDVALLRSRLIESLYVEAMLLADDTRFYFEASSDPHGPTIDPVTRIGMFLFDFGQRRFRTRRCPSDRR